MGDQSYFYGHNLNPGLKLLESITRPFFVRLVTDVSCTSVAMQTVQANLKVTNLAQFERFTVQNLPKFSSLYKFEL